MSSDDNISDRELLIQLGFQPHQIIDFPDGTSVLNYAVLKEEITRKGSKAPPSEKP